MSSPTRRARAAWLVWLSCGLACGAPPARAPAAPVDLPRMFAAAFRADAVGDPGEAVQAYVAVVRAASRAGGDPWQAAALEASLDAVATRSMPSLGDVARDV